MNKLSGGIVQTSRIRLARNLSNLAFPHKMTDEAAFAFVKRATDILNVNNEYGIMLVGQLNAVDREILLNKNLVSRDLLKNNRTGCIMLSKDESLSIMFNEEDHIRIQAVVQGLDFDTALTIAKQIDNMLIGSLPIAYDANLGFLTSCPSNVGTGMRASVMLFLPALTINNSISEVINSLSKIRITVRGAFGEGSAASGYMYQISNQVSLGVTEKEILQLVTDTVNRLCSLENQARQVLLATRQIEVTDAVCRAWGIASNAYTLTAAEFCEYYAQIKLGVGLGILHISNASKLDELNLQAQNAGLGKQFGEMDETKLNLKRAEIVRETLKKITA